MLLAHGANSRVTDAASGVSDVDLELVANREQAFDLYLLVDHPADAKLLLVD